MLGNVDLLFEGLCSYCSAKRILSRGGDNMSQNQWKCEVLMVCISALFMWPLCSATFAKRSERHQHIEHSKAIYGTI